jgi:hypothetical protein
LNIPPLRAAVDEGLTRRRDRDLLVADCLRHLHLSTTIEADGFVERDDDLRFGAFTPCDAVHNVCGHVS